VAKTVSWPTHTAGGTVVGASLVGALDVGLSLVGGELVGGSESGVIVMVTVAISSSPLPSTTWFQGQEHVGC